MWSPLVAQWCDSKTKIMMAHCESFIVVYGGYKDAPK